MLSNKSNKELVEAGHQFAKALDADMPLTEIAKLVSALSARLDCSIVRGDELQQKLDAMAAENAALKCKNPIGYVKDADVADVANGRVGSLMPNNVFGEKPVYLSVETPATDAYLNSVRAEVIPKGYILVPQQMHISADAMESICFHGGDGDGQFGEFTDVILWVGHIENDDGTKTYGLNITTAEYPEEGSANISEFVEPIGSGTHDTADKAGAK
ncbi:hypothetical protein [Pantoea ananatis]|uniref:hypothetical protein n=1 Tax=Pantoea ananas TaxID=553 RepID=UPI0007366B34|nr:hypothetical protein [Pantoea ananatis]